MNYQHFLLLVLITAVFSCSKNSKYSDEHEQITSDSILKIKFKQPSHNICNSNFEEFTISDSTLIKETITALNEATVNGPWKGACWIEIDISSKNNTLTLKANEKVFCSNNCVTFYDFPSESFIEQLRQKSNQINVEKNGMLSGYLLPEFMDFEEVKQIKISNVKGPHYLTKSQWKEIKTNLIKAKSVGGLRCKPSGACLSFELNNGEQITGCICGDLINFESSFSGSFRLPSKMNFHNY